MQVVCLSLLLLTALALVLATALQPALWFKDPVATGLHPLATETLEPIPVCLKLFAQTASEKYYRPESTSGQTIPPNLLSAFTWTGRAEYVYEEPIFSIYNNPKNEPYVWESEYIADLIGKAKDRDWAGWTTYERADGFASALDRFSVLSKDVVVYGTEKPWVEAIALAAGRFL